MIVHNFDPVLIDLGILQIRWYSLAYILGILIGWIQAIRIIKFTQFNDYNFKAIKKSQFDDLLIYLIIGIVVGGRLGYVLFYNIEYYLQNFFEIFKIWYGGMSFHGGLIGVIIATFLFCKRANANFFKFTDIICCVAPIGIFLGRIANFINGELYGKISNLPWSVIFPEGGNVGRHPSQIYEAFSEGLLLFVILAILVRLVPTKGKITAVFLTLYGLLRFLVEFVRVPDAHLGYISDGWATMGQILSLPMVFAGLAIWVICGDTASEKVKPRDKMM